MALSALIVKFSDLRKTLTPGCVRNRRTAGREKTMTIPLPRPRRRKPLDAGPFAPEIAQRRDAAIIAVLTATGIRAGELAGIRYDPDDPWRSDVDL
jgi:hypothetical protein